MPGAWTTHDWYVFHAFALFLTNPCFENDKFNTINGKWRPRSTIDYRIELKHS